MEHAAYFLLFRIIVNKETLLYGSSKIEVNKVICKNKTEIFTTNE